MQSIITFRNRFAGLFTVALALGIAGVAPTAQAQAPSVGGEALAKTALGFLNTGGYFLTGSARHAIGSTKFYNAGGFYAKPKHLGAINITGGVEFITAGDHFLPFQGGDYFNLIGPVFRVSTAKDFHGIQPYFTVGLFYGALRSVQRGFDRSAFTPGFSVGVDYKLARHVSVGASYRVSQEIAGYNTDGLGVFLRLY